MCICEELQIANTVGRSPLLLTPGLRNPLCHSFIAAAKTSGDDDQEEDDNGDEGSDGSLPALTSLLKGKQRRALRALAGKAYITSLMRHASLLPLFMSRLACLDSET